MSHIPPHGSSPYYGGYPPPPGAYPPPPSGSYAYVPVAAPAVMMPMYHPPPHHPPPHHPPPHYPPPHHPPHHPEPHYSPPPPEPPQSTYVTNIIYQQPETVTVVQEPPPPVMPRPWQAIAEIAETCLSEVNKRMANKDSHVFCSDVALDWVPATPSTAAPLTHRAFVGGKEGWESSPLWVIRSHHCGELIPGKFSIKHRAAYVPHGNREVPVHNFEVLCAPQNALRWLPASNGQVPVGAIAAGNTHNGEPLYIARVRHLRATTPGKVHPSHGCAYISYGGSEIQHKSYEVLCKFVG